MSQSLSLHCGLSQSLECSQSLLQTFGENGGDIPIYSLHRISGLLVRKPIGISGDVSKFLKKAIVEANKEYKAQSGNDWNCLTSLNLTSAIEAVEAQIAGINDVAVKSLPRELAGQMKTFEAFFAKKRSECIVQIRDWFVNNHDDLFYNMDGKVPWAIIQRLRAKLGMWIIGIDNPFEQDIEEMILEVAKEQKIATDNAEDAWEAMGGKLSKT